jgi:cell wall-associated protease
MKTNFMLACTLIFSLVAFSQIPLANSKWKPQTEIPRIQFDFKKDTLSILFTSSREAEIMIFSQQHDSLFIKKISGTGSCPAGSEGWYRIAWFDSGEKLVLHNINDDCSGRIAGFTAHPFDRIRNENDIPRNWSYKSLQKDSMPGINLYGAYELLKGRKSQPVIIAVLGSGIDRNHEDLKEVMWTNTKEIAGNGVDDDKNGYVDDEWGWNYLSDKEGNTITRMQEEATYIYKLWKNKYDNANASKLKPAEKEEYQIYIEAKKDWQENYNFIRLYKLVVDDSVGFFNEVKGIADKTSLEKMPRSDLVAYDPGTNEFKEAVRKILLKDIFPQNNPKTDSVWLSNLLRNSIQWRTFKNYVNSFILDYDPEYEPLKIIRDHPLKMDEHNYGSPYIRNDPAISFDHDTHIAGIIGAKGNNGIGIDGIADSVKIMMIKIGAGGNRDKDAANAIRYAVDNGAKVINLSWTKRFSSHKKLMDDAIYYAEQKDVLIVRAAGNDGDDCDTADYYPTAKYKDGKIAQNFIIVGGTRRFYDSRLPLPYSNYGQHTVDLFAPGQDSYAPFSDSKYGYSSGTSNAAPIVVGIAALLKSYFPELTMLQIKNIILETAYRPDLKVVNPRRISPIPPAVRGGQQNQGRVVPFSSLSITGGISDAEAAVRKALEITKK